MKKILFTLLFISLNTGFALASQWCQWDGSQGVNCQSDSRGYIVISGFKVKTPAVANAKGYYKRVDTPATLGTDQVIDAQVWSFANNEIGLTWTVRDLTTAEINARDSAAMPLSEYWLWKALILKGVITQTEAASVLPDELIEAYLARKAIEDAQ